MRDLLRVRLISLTLFVIFISLVASEGEFILDVDFEKFSLVVAIVGVRCVLFFSSVRVFLFFFFFEMRLIPTVGLILG